ncbi:hypothetical protein JCGZ_16283 [Jatropha curcas]|uniref:Uncharacterized protein n=1 Tax=Jatropha curcas TaxID=180498 RepID=A0A067LIK1_JATCU|nr:hypothetical protein JCGZ_16283 [Jatropha curcas]
MSLRSILYGTRLVQQCLKWLGRSCALIDNLTSRIGCKRAERSNNAYLRRYGRDGRKLEKILHLRESVRSTYGIDTVRLEVTEQVCLNTLVDPYLL